VLGGGAAPQEEGGGQYFVKTIFTGVRNKMRIAQEEVFGPVLSVIKFKDEDEAVEIANDIAYGLGAGDRSRRRAPRHPAFSQWGVGRMALGPVLREYIVSEAMAALGNVMQVLVQET
jgi:acyl-CoA reductase-like NAD-dependent aldehyde dehydrogenase